MFLESSKTKALPASVVLLVLIARPDLVPRPDSLLVLAERPLSTIPEITNVSLTLKM